MSTPVSTLGASANSGAEPVRPGFELDVERLTHWCRANVEGF